VGPGGATGGDDGDTTGDGIAAELPRRRHAEQVTFVPIERSVRVGHVGSRA